MSGKPDAVLFEMSSRSEKSPSDCPEEPNLRLSVLSLVESLCRGTAIVLAIYVWWDCLQEYYKLRPWHGPFFTTAYMVFLSEGLLIFLPHNTLTRDWRRKYRIKLHWILQLAGLSCICFGIITIVAHKLLNNKIHFAEPHSITGLVAVILAVIVTLFGCWTRLDRKYHYGIKLSHLKLAHVFLGVVAYGVGVAAQVLGYFSNFYKEKHDFEWRLFLSVITALLGTLTFLFALNSFYFRFKTFLKM